ncbi:MAG: NAD(+)/NADH kinase [Bacillaceae bacterium]|nr:NAD(+)/NADH kinase [Bacillaceae bacterium]
MKTIGLVINKGKPNAWVVAKELTFLLEEKQAGVYLEPTVAQYIGRGDLGMPLDDFHKHVDILFVLGGDGTLLGIARKFAPYDIPILGINLGHLGFLSEAEPDDLPHAVDQILDGDYYVEDRMMLETELIRKGKRLETFTAFNDVGIAKGSFSRIIRCAVYVEDLYLTTFSGDGVIVSSPTGSTAYSLSAGGPIVAPNVDCLLLTPVAPHSLVARPFVLSPDDEIRIQVDATHQDIGLTVDGQLGLELEVQDEIKIRRSPYITSLIKWKKRNFFSVVRKKLQGESC